MWRLLRHVFVASMFYVAAESVLMSTTGLPVALLPREAVAHILPAMAVAVLLTSVVRQTASGLLLSLLFLAALTSAVTPEGLRLQVLLPLAAVCFVGCFDERYPKAARSLAFLILGFVFWRNGIRDTAICAVALVVSATADRYLAEGKQILISAFRTLLHQRSALGAFFLIYGSLVFGFALTYLDLRPDGAAFQFDPPSTPEPFSRYFYLSAVTITNCGSGGAQPLNAPSRVAVAAESILGVFVVVLYLQHVFQQAGRLRGDRGPDTDSLGNQGAPPS